MLSPDYKNSSSLADSDDVQFVASFLINLNFMITLDHTNFLVWRVQILLIITTYGIDDFINPFIYPLVIVKGTRQFTLKFV